MLVCSHEHTSILCKKETLCQYHFLFFFIYFSKRSFNLRYRFAMLLSPALSRNRQKGTLSVSLCLITQAQHFLWFSHSVFGQAQSVTLGQAISIPSSLEQRLATFAVTATAGRFFACEPTHNNRCRTTNACINFYRSRRAIQSTSPALHARIFLDYIRPCSIRIKYPVWADFHALAAANALFRNIG